jgi:hypothetical protein
MVDRHKVLEAESSSKSLRPLSPERKKEIERERKRKKERKKLISRTKCMLPPSFPYISFWV